jgi:hypothetical protein
MVIKLAPAQEQATGNELALMEMLKQKVHQSLQ